MARARNLKPGFFKNEDLAECDPLARLLFAGLWTIADREGRLEDRPKRIRAELLPYDVVDVDALLCQLVRQGFIVRYSVAGERYIAIPTFTKNQQPHIHEAPSVIPPPEQADTDTLSNKEEYHTSTVQVPDEHGANSPLTESLNLNHESLTSDREKRGEEAFQVFWQELWTIYPRNSDGKKPGKPLAEKAARNVPIRDRPLVLQAVRNYANSDSVRRGAVKYPQGFLNPNFWPDYVEPPAGGNNGQNGTNRQSGATAEGTQGGKWASRAGLRTIPLATNPPETKAG